MKKETNTDVVKNWRYPKYVLVGYLLLFLILLVAFAYLSLSPKVFGKDLKAFAEDRITVRKELIAKRGTIYDAEGNVLAIDVTSYTLIAYLDSSRTSDMSEPKHVIDKEMTAKKLSEVLDAPYDYVLERLEKEGVYQVEFGSYGSKLTELDKIEIEALELPGIDFIESSKRFYPNGTFASYIIGYAKQYTRINIKKGDEYDLYDYYKNYFNNYDDVTIEIGNKKVISVNETKVKGLKVGTSLLYIKTKGDNLATIMVNVTDYDNYQTMDTTIVGELGVESNYNDILKGENGSLLYQKDPSGYQIPDTYENRVEAVDGNDIYLTIDSNVQRFLETAVSDAVEGYDPEWMIMAVMDAKTGEILGSATYPSFDANSLPSNMSYQNPLISYAYEPGSVMKTYTYMCAIETGLYDGEQTYKSGQYKVGPDVVSDWKPRGWGKISYDTGYMYSSNVGSINVAKEYLSAEKLRDCLKQYGFGSTTGIELSGELSGSLNFNGQIELDWLSASYGQGLSTTAIQQLQALSIIANDGVMVKPHIIKKIVNTKTGEETVTQIVRSEQIVSKETTDKVKELMYGAINNSWTPGYTYAVKGFNLIGKTGTAQIYENGRYLTGDGNYLISFAGMYPKDDPQIIIYAAMKKPSTYSARALAPSVKSVVRNVAKYRNIFSTVKEETSVSSYTLPSYINQNTDAVVSSLTQDEIDVIVIGNGSTIINQYPIKGSTIITNDKVFLVTNGNEIVLENVIGWSRNDFIKYMDLIGLSYNISGYGYIKEQSIQEGTVIQDNMVVEVKLSNKYNLDGKKEED